MIHVVLLILKTIAFFFFVSASPKAIFDHKAVKLKKLNMDYGVSKKEVTFLKLFAASQIMRIKLCAQHYVLC